MIGSPFIGGGVKAGTYPSKGSVDASLAANLPANPFIGDTYDISVAGSFEGDALIIPSGAYFSVPDQVRWNEVNWVKMEAGDNISDAAFDASWDGNVNSAPSKNAVYDEMILKMDKASNLSDVASVSTSQTNLNVFSKVESNIRNEERNWYKYTIPVNAVDGPTTYSWFEHFKVTAAEPFSVMVKRDGEGYMVSDFGFAAPTTPTAKEIQDLLFDAVLEVTDPNGCDDAVTGTTSIVRHREILSQSQLGTDTVHIYFSDGGSPTAKRWALSQTFDIYVSTDNGVTVEANYADSEDVTFTENFFAVNPTSTLRVIYPSLPIRDAVFGAGWDGDTFKAPSRNAVYDEVIKKVNILDITTAGFGFVIDEDNLVSNLATKVPTQQSVKAYVDTEVLEPLADQLIFGFVSRTQTTLTFDPVTYTLTLASVGANWSYYRSGVKYTITGNKTLTLTGNPIIPDAGKFFIYIDSATGALVKGPVWTLAEDDTKVPVAVLSWNNSFAPKYELSDERHTIKFNRLEHLQAHSTIGTQLEPGGGEISNYLVAQTSPTNAHNTFTIGPATIWDEDIKLDCKTIPDGGPYHIKYRTGAGVWAWEEGARPFRVGTTYIQYDNAGTMADVSNGNYVNIYLLANNANDNAAWTIIHGQAQHNALALAQAEKFGNLTLTGLPSPELVAVWQITYQASNGYSSTGKCRIAATPVRINSSLVQSVTYPTLGTMSTQNANAVDITGGSIGTAVTGVTQAVNNDTTLLATTAFARAEVYDLTNKAKDVATQTYTVDATDRGQTIFFTYAGAVTITLPISLPQGISFTCVPVGATTTLTFVTSGGATVASKGGLFNVTDQYGPATAVHRGSNAWYLFGNLA